MPAQTKTPLERLVRTAKEIQRELKKGECNLNIVLQAELDDALMELGNDPPDPRGDPGPLQGERARVWTGIRDALQGPYEDLAFAVRGMPKWRAFVDVRLHGIVWGTEEPSIRAYEKWRETANPGSHSLILERIKGQLPQ